MRRGDNGVGFSNLQVHAGAAGLLVVCSNLVFDTEGSENVCRCRARVCVRTCVRVLVSINSVGSHPSRVVLPAICGRRRHRTLHTPDNKRGQEKEPEIYRAKREAYLIKTSVE